RLLVLQAAAWMPAMRDDLVRMVGLSMSGSGLQAAPSSERPSTAAVLASGSPERTCELLQRDPASADAVLAGLRSGLARCGVEHHQHKYAAAMQEEAQRVHASFRHLVIAPAVDYLAHPDDEETEVHRRAEQALDKATVR
ncbi:MAG: hypothetical protein ABIP94_11105, partial [Planctomycetota bacterium]